MKQLESDPWEGVAAKYPVGAKLKGTVTNITDYGAFVELEPGIEGLVHVSEMRSDEHTSELQSLMRLSYAVFCLINKNTNALLTQQLSTHIHHYSAQLVVCQT